jgi:phospholipase C
VGDSGGLGAAEPRGQASARVGRVVLVAAVLAVALAGAGLGRVGAAPRRASLAAGQAATATRGPAGRIKHVVIFYQENHSFDEVLGEFCVRHHHRCDGYVGKVHLSDGTVAPMTVGKDIIPRVWHNVVAQERAMNGGKMDGWNKVPGCNPPKWPRSCLQYYTPEQIPNYTSLAAKYTVNDRMFSMYDSPSFGGHIYVAAATQDDFTGDVPRPAPRVKAEQGWGCSSNRQAAWISPKTHKKSMQPACIPARAGKLDKRKYPYNGPYRPSPVQWVPTIFDRLDAKHVSWKIYTSIFVWAVCPTFAECAYTGQAKHMVSPYQIITDAQTGHLPAFSLLLPGGKGGTTQHNGSSMRAGDNWIGQIMDELQKSRQWSSTAVFITYDDCGCFYDHVPPGKNPDGSQQGIRLPMVIAGGYAKKGFTDHNAATFAGMLKFTEEAFGLKPLGINDTRAYDYSNAFNFGAKPTGARAALRQYPVPEASKRYLATHPQGDEIDDPT